MRMRWCEVIGLYEVYIRLYEVYEVIFGIRGHLTYVRLNEVYQVS